MNIMFLAVHASVGALTGKVAPDPVSAFVLGFISHFFVDMIPHGDEHMYEGYVNGAKKKRAVLYVTADALATTALIAVLFLREDFVSTASVFLGIMGSILPDMLVGLYELLKPKRLTRFHRFHMKNHHFLIKRLRKFERDIPFKYGLLLQCVVLSYLVRVIM